MTAFTPPTSGATRLSDDVWELICNHATKNGNSSTREALEQLIRQTIGDAKAACCHCSAEEIKEEPIPTERNQNSSGNAAAALDALLIN